MSTCEQTHPKSLLQWHILETHYCTWSQEYTTSSLAKTRLNYFQLLRHEWFFSFHKFESEKVNWYRERSHKVCIKILIVLVPWEEGFERCNRGWCFSGCRCTATGWPWTSSCSRRKRSSQSWTCTPEVRHSFISRLVTLRPILNCEPCMPFEWSTNPIIKVPKVGHCDLYTKPAPWYNHLLWLEYTLHRGD